ncbi:hypothetical protein [Actinoalloteichus sp. GBA129-24]|uniref:hypothetical protein n=1 Tax=Actinoalloteichus sp. GBA129-24 TaxID=1612551 RepID=UPI0009507535|nr:hypothetical protein [Actinoalloteichus sp. GBA129-24]APU20887.1 hypothetical protein UA75_14385 [Actinoalloteichus sp. GBA129-24]APU24136.1 hypothetical protein UA75_30865 [Actinoalloteichus sp. GBA129-24]
MSTPATRRRLATLLDDARQQLGLSRTALARKAGVSLDPLKSLLDADDVTIRDASARRIEEAVEWSAGTIPAVLDGDITDPRPIEPLLPGGTIDDVDVDHLMSRLDDDQGELTPTEVAAALRVLNVIATRLGDDRLRMWVAGWEAGRQARDSR